MFLSAVIPLTALTTSPTEEFTGRQALAAVLAVIGQKDAALAESFHADGEQRKPFTVSPLMSSQSRPRWQASVTQGENYLIRLTSLDAEFSRRLLDDILPALPLTLRIGGAEFQTGQALTEQKQHPLARQSNAQALYDEWFDRATAVRQRVELEFFSPTAIKQRGRNLVVPLPAAIFQGYLRAWNQFGKPALAEDLLEIIERDVVITRYELKTSLLSLRQVHDDTEPRGERQHQLGFLGRCAFTCFSPERALWRTLHLLADFAFFCGTGYKTTQGMGQTRKIKAEG